MPYLGLIPPHTHQTVIAPHKLSAKLLVSIEFAKWQHQYALSGNGKKSFSPSLDSDDDPNHHYEVKCNCL